MRHLLVVLVIVASCAKDKDPAPAAVAVADSDSAVELAEDVSQAVDVTAADIAAAATLD